jgi:2-polyprenyl-6-methoxyphenol hydroxylase-like FAD-dependent oxidoreductase
MNVLIAGGGQVGALIARRLIREGNAVTIVDPSPERGAPHCWRPPAKELLDAMARPIERWAPVGADITSWRHR